jgi:hypothetical protein
MTIDFLNIHEKSYILGNECPLCINFKHLRILDKDIDENALKLFCKEDRKTVNKMILKRMVSTAQRIHVIGNHWPLVNALKHRKFRFFCRIQKDTDQNDSICITDTTVPVDKTEHKLIITQGYDITYNLNSVDFLLVQKKYINESFAPDWAIPEKGYLIIDLKNGNKFYTEE